MQNLILLITVIFLVIHVHFSISVPLIDNNNNNNNNHERLKRSGETLLPNGNFSIVTDEKVLKLKELASAVHDPKLYDLYRAVNHYVQMAKNNNEYVLWKYDSNQEGLVLMVKQNLNGILYYG